MIELAARTFAGHELLVHESDRLALGFTGSGFPAADLKKVFPSLPLLFLKQVHSSRIARQSDWRAGLEADGLFLERPGAVAVIQTADCLPLFFFNDDRSRGGVIHVGWRGLQQGIEENLATLLGREIGQYVFFLGPAIEKKCYEVGPELPPLFAKKAYGKDIFTKARHGKYLLDIKAGLKLSLEALGVAPGRIGDCGLCTCCSGGRFPSYRRDGQTGKRIFNFLLLKVAAPGRD